MFDELDGQGRPIPGTGLEDIAFLGGLVTALAFLSYGLLYVLMRAMGAA